MLQYFITRQSKKATVLDTPRMVGWAILEYAKLHMYDFYYNVLKVIFGDNIKIVYMDTDSIHYIIMGFDAPEDQMYQWNVKCIADEKPPVFDLSLFSKYKKSCLPFAGTVGLFKHEQGDDEMVEAVYTAAKMYVYICKKDEEYVQTMKGKGVPTWALEQQYKTLEVYKQAVLENNAPPVEFRAMRPEDHVMQHRIIRKSCLTADNDKVFLLSPFASRPLGHKDNRLEESLEGWSAFELPEDKVLKALMITIEDETDAVLVDDEKASAEDSESDKDEDSEFADDEASDSSEHD